MENYLNEIYILRERLKSYFTIVGRLLPKGATRNDESISVTRETELSAVLIDHSFHFCDDSQRMERELRAFRSIWPHVRGIQSAGCPLYLAQLAEGQLGAFVANELGLWSLAGSSVILEEAGDRVTDLDGQSLDLSYDASNWRHRLQAIGANPQLHKKLLSRVPASC